MDEHHVGDAVKHARDNARLTVAEGGVHRPCTEVFGVGVHAQNAKPPLLCKLLVECDEGFADASPSDSTW